MKLNEKAMLTELNISQCTFRKLDKTVTNEINNIHSAKRAAGNYNKATLAKEDLARIVRAVGNARTTFYQLTLPWSDKGPRILPAKLYWEYTTKMRACQSDFEIAVEDFFANYAQFQANAKQILGTMYKDEDYPTETKARLKFNFKTSITPLPDATDFRVDINTAEIDKIKAEYEASSRTMLNSAVQDVWQRLYQGIGNMVERLSDPSNVFRDSLVQNLCELSEILPKLNITDDPELDRLGRAVEENLCAFSAQELRDNTTIRTNVADDAAELLKQMEAYCGIAG